MLNSDSKCWRKKKSQRLFLFAALAFLIFSELVTVVKAQDFWPLENPFVPFLSFPQLRGEAKLTVINAQIQSGYFTNARQEGKTYNFRDFFHSYDQPNVFLDCMLKAQLGRFSSRTYYEFRGFSGEFVRTPTVSDRINLEYAGYRQGADVDIFLGNKSRVGFNIDFSFYGPKLRMYLSDSPDQSLEFSGPQYSGTIGAHAVYNPVWNIYGMSLIAEAWAHWPISGTSLTDYEISGGLKSAETVLGSIAVQAGYRWTSIDFSNYEHTYSDRVNVSWGGVFGSLVYYYR
jgi:hypothetical protein